MSESERPRAAAGRERQRAVEQSRDAERRVGTVEEQFYVVRRGGCELPIPRDASIPEIVTRLRRALLVVPMKLPSGGEITRHSRDVAVKDGFEAQRELRKAALLLETYFPRRADAIKSVLESVALDLHLLGADPVVGDRGGGRSFRSEAALLDFLFSVLERDEGLTALRQQARRAVELLHGHSLAADEEEAEVRRIENAVARLRGLRQRPRSTRRRRRRPSPRA